MTTSNYLNNGSKGELNAVRHCMFNDKLFLHEKIIEFDNHVSFTIEVVKHNLPMVKQMSATYELTPIGKNKTELKMTSYNSFSPKFMKYLMTGQMSKSLIKHLFGLKYYIETGKIVNAANYTEILKTYK